MEKKLISEILVLHKNKKKSKDYVIYAVTLKDFYNHSFMALKLSMNLMII